MVTNLQIKYKLVKGYGADKMCVIPSGYYK